MVRSLLRGEQIVDVDVLSETEHDMEPHYFNNLVDVTTYSGNPGKYVAVNASGTGLDCVQNTLLGLADTPETYDTGKYLQSNSSGTEWAGIKEQWIVKTSDYTTSDGDRVVVDTTLSGSYTIALPSGPVYGDRVCVFDAGGNCGTVSVTIDRNGENIQGADQDLIVDDDGASFELMFYNVSRGWVIYE